MLDNHHKSRILVNKPIFMKFIRDEKIIDFLKDQNHYPILKILKNKPMTVKELVIAYEKETNKKKSNITIYRYLKNLEEAELVIAAGQLVISGKTATETIYERSAMAFYLVGKSASQFTGYKGELITKGIGKFLSPLFNNKNINEEKLLELIQEYEKIKLDEIEKLIPLIGDNMVDIFENCDFKEINLILEFSSLIAGLKAYPDLIDKFAACFD